MSDDCAYGVGAVNGLLARFGLQDQWCFVDAQGRTMASPASASRMY